jgi:hypothetical protein
MSATNARDELRERIEAGAPDAELDDAVANVGRHMDTEERAALWLYGWHYTRDSEAAGRLERSSAGEA